jgi:hypothetical protein
MSKRCLVRGLVMTFAIGAVAWISVVVIRMAPGPAADGELFVEDPPDGGAYHSQALEPKPDRAIACLRPIKNFDSNGRTQLDFSRDGRFLVVETAIGS